MQPGVQRFIDDMTKLGGVPRLEAGLVVYRVEPVDGAYAGIPVETGVGVDELSSWPLAPPHWIHFPSSVRFSRTNSQASPQTGMGNAQPPDLRVGRYLRLVSAGSAILELFSARRPRDTVHVRGHDSPYRGGIARPPDTR